MTLGDKPKLNLTSDEKFYFEILRDINTSVGGRRRLWESEVSRYKSGFRDEYFSALGTLNAMGLAEKHWSSQQQDSYWTVTKAGKLWLRNRR